LIGNNKNRVVKFVFNLFTSKMRFILIDIYIGVWLIWLFKSGYIMCELIDVNNLKWSPQHIVIFSCV
jgi:hypothetical protein